MFPTNVNRTSGRALSEVHGRPLKVYIHLKLFFTERGLDIPDLEVAVVVEGFKRMVSEQQSSSDHRRRGHAP